MSQPADISDFSLIQIMKAQGKTQGQAECSIALLKFLGYSQVERANILTERNNAVHRVCYFGSLWPMVLIVIGICLGIASLTYNLFPW